MLISKEKFIEIMNEFKVFCESSDKLADALRDYDNTSDFGGFSNFRAMDIIIDLLDILVQDFPDEYCGSLIDYFIYDLEWGTKWTPDSFSEQDGTSIDISTVEKLYDYLESNYKENHGESGN